MYVEIISNFSVLTKMNICLEKKRLISDVSIFSWRKLEKSGAWHKVDYLGVGSQWCGVWQWINADPNPCGGTCHVHLRVLVCTLRLSNAECGDGIKFRTAHCHWVWGNMQSWCITRSEFDQVASQPKSFSARLFSLFQTCNIGNN